MVDTDNEIRQAFALHLMPGEEIRWCAEAQPDRIWISKPWAGPLLLIVGIAVLWLEYEFLLHGQWAVVVTPLGWLSVPALLAAVVGFLLTSATIIRLRDGDNRDRYAATNRRLLLISGVAGNLRSMPIDQIRAEVRGTREGIESGQAGPVDSIGIRKLVEGVDEKFDPLGIKMDTPDALLSNVADACAVCDLINELGYQLRVEKLDSNKERPLAASSPDVDPRAADVFGSDLHPDEVILWFGQPLPGTRPNPAVRFLRVSCVVEGLAAVGVGMLSAHFFQRGWFPLFLLCLLFSAWLLLMAFVSLRFSSVGKASTGEHAHYALTNKRVLAMHSAFGARSIRAVEIPAITIIGEGKPNTNGGGTLIFRTGGTTRKMTVEEARAKNYVVFADLQDPASIKDMVEKLRGEATSA